ncbi:MAG: hypothetical protein IPM96_19740 [Ignavibacteria bacterium]|nr:hypothetical protein [Ignavibacteria bacterium]
MEFYRKICNNCYWSSVYSGKKNILKQSLLLLVSIIPLLFFALSYSPADPANLNRSSFYTKLISLFTGLKIQRKTSHKYYFERNNTSVRVACKYGTNKIQIT